MAEQLILSSVFQPFLQVVFQIAADFLVEEISLENDLQNELRVLRDNVAMIRATLNDAEKIIPSPPLKLWLDKLREVGYDAIDVLDEHYTELRRQNLIHYPELRSKLSIVNPKRVYYRYDMSHKIKEASLKMSDVFQRRINFGLTINGSSFVTDRGDITTSLPPTHTVGREIEKSEILNKIIPNDGVEPKMSTLAIHGMDRIGKTTLAQLVYNDEKILKHFEMRLWVHVSYEFDLEKVTRWILESMDEPLVAGVNLDTLQRRIQKKLQGKRFLLVLDNFWNEKRHQWEKLIRPLNKGAPGSVIIVTTRIKLVAEIVSTLPSFHLTNVSEYDCYSLVNQYASDSHRDGSTILYELRSEIYRYCRGMPEKAIDLGDQLRREHDRAKWNEIILNWDDGCTFSEEKYKFVSSMRSTYALLPSYLKPCLAYCSIIPKGESFEKEWIIQLWMAQNFIADESEKRIEDIGDNYFDLLEKRSCFQQTRLDHSRDWYEYSIPDAVHEFAQQISTKECCIFELSKPHNLTDTTKHMSIILASEDLSGTRDPFTEIYRCRGLYTLLVFGGLTADCSLKLSGDLLKCLERLRTLDLRNCNLPFLPNNIGDLKHLRYLQLQNSKFQELPESISDLYNLQTLGLRNCFDLRKLPKETKRLQQLRHLDLHLDYPRLNVNQNSQSLEFMPPDLGLLTNLQVLSRFVVSMKKHCGISELENLNSLRGELSISNLDLVKNLDDVAKANLQEKKHIKRLEFHWRGGTRLCQYRSERFVLENLKPNSNVKELKIVGYPGMLLPSWLGLTDLSNLCVILLSDCTNCRKLPPLGNLPLLQELHIRGMSSLKSINWEFCGKNQVHFPSLKKLFFENMLSLEKWSAHENCELPHLSELILKDCANLKILEHNISSLTKLEIENLPAFVSMCRYPSLKDLKAVAVDNWVWKSWQCLASLHYLTLCQLSWETLPAGLPKILDSLQNLKINDCHNLVMLPDDWIPPGVTSLCIKDCPMLQSLPKGLETLKALEILVIQDCKNLVSLPELNNLKTLTRLEISGCHSFEHLPSKELPDTLHTLRISDCPLFSKQFEDLQSPERKKIKNVSSVWIDQKHFPTTRDSTQGENSNNNESMRVSWFSKFRL